MLHVAFAPFEQSFYEIVHVHVHVHLKLRSRFDIITVLAGPELLAIDVWRRPRFDVETLKASAFPIPASDIRLQTNSMG